MPDDRWAYKVEHVEDGSVALTLMRWRTPIQIEITNTFLGCWVRNDDLAYTFFGIEDDDWESITEEEARALAEQEGITWFDAEAEKEIPVGSVPWPEID